MVGDNHEDGHEEDHEENESSEEVHVKNHEKHKSSEEVHVKKENSPGGVTEIVRENPWILSTIILGVILLVFLVTSFTNLTGNAISEDKAGEKMLNFVRAQTGGEGNITQVKSFDNNFYEIIVYLQGQEIPAYVTKDGKYFVPAITSLDVADSIDSQTQEETAQAPKSDKPKAELFIMTHCPYGTQAEKGFIPMINEIDDVIDSKIRFIHYFMHGEKEENETHTEVCIREEQSTKFIEYLTCFLEDGNSSRCLAEAKVDTGKLNNCLKNGKAQEYYAVDSELSEKYGVQGSPTLVVNEQIVSSGRSPAAFLNTVCLAFNVAPEKCATLNLSTETPASMWGWGASSSASSAAQCA
ncbi:MAG: thioredoxin domain-containing protein [archaeon]